MEILKTLGIDWALLIAQIVNFAIVLFVLAKFVYRPVMATIDRRQQIIKESMEKAEEIERQRQAAEKVHQELLRKADSEAGEILAKAKADGDAMRKQIVDAAHVEAAKILENGKKQLEQERQRVFADVQATLTNAIVVSTERILKREFKPEDQKRLLSDLEKSLPSLVS